MADDACDTIVIGSGLAGLSVAALLARDGEHVRVLEAHEHPGGYAHTFSKGAYRFCAELHYVFDAGEAETIDRFLAAIGRRDAVRFVRLDPEGFDHVVVDGERHRIPNGLAKHCERLIHELPGDEKALRAYFHLLSVVREELRVLPEEPNMLDRLAAPLRFPHLLRDRHATLGDVFDRLGLSPRARTVLAGQCGDYLLPPSRAPFLVHALVVTSYDQGAYYPERHFFHLVDEIVASITDRPGCSVELGCTVDRIEVEAGRVAGVRTRDGRLHRARRYVSNADPRRTAELAGREQFSHAFLRSLEYAYSSSCITLFLGLRGVDLREHGFGSYNVWHYPDDDVDGAYARQASGDFERPWLFLSTPTLHTSAPGLAPVGQQTLCVATSASAEPFVSAPGLAPVGQQTLCVATSASAEPFVSLHRSAPDTYRALKHGIVERILDEIESRYVPRLRDRIEVRIAGTPATNARIVQAPAGNAYGATLEALARRIPMRTSIPNLWLCNASAGWPSAAGTIGSGLRLHSTLRAEDA